MITERLRRIECDSTRSEGTATADGWPLLWNILWCLCLLTPACQPTATEEVPHTQITIDSTATQFLLYPQQGLLELWSIVPASPNVLLDSFPLSVAIDFPIGIYPLEMGTNGPLISYPNAFYREKLGSKTQQQQLSFSKWRKKYPRLEAWEAQSEGKRVLVMAQEACFACPHWMAEVYSQLEAAR